jgi:anthranilate synthase/aminodeoxychorismate synthase-like glutamine amidotransferase
VYLLIDNYDSFTYNLYQYFSEQKVNVKVVRNDQISIKEIDALKPEAIIISPGPGTPEEAGICIETVQRFYQSVPILGVCLGHQTIAVALGGKLRQAKEIKHGKTSFISHNGQGVFTDLPEPVEVMRYHSLVIDEQVIPDSLEIVAKSIDDHEIMAVQHRHFPTYGIQFHPESIGTEVGKQMICNFLQKSREEIIR